MRKDTIYGVGDRKWDTLRLPNATVTKLELFLPIVLVHMETMYGKGFDKN